MSTSETVPEVAHRKSRRSCSCTAPSPAPRSGRASSRPGSPRAATRSRCRGSRRRCRAPARLRDYVAPRRRPPPTRSARRRWWSATRSAGWSRSISRRGGGWRGWCSSPRPGPAASRPSLWQLSAAGARRAGDAAAGPGRRRRRWSASRRCAGRSSPRRRRDAWIAEVALPCPIRESPLALLDGLTWDLPAWFLVRRAPVLARARRPRRLRADHRPLGDRAGLRRGDRADPRRRATGCRSTRTGRASPGGSTPGSTSAASAPSRVRRAGPAAG